MPQGLCGCFGDIGTCPFQPPAAYILSPLPATVCRSRRLTRQAALPQTGCLGTCFPCVLSMEIAAEAQTQSLCHCLATSTLAFGPYFPVYLVSGCLLRRKFRRAKHIKGGVLDDCCCGGCCHWLNLCQMAREIIATRVHAAPPV